MNRFQSAGPGREHTGNGGTPLSALADDARQDPLDGELGLITRDLGRRAGADRTVLALRDAGNGGGQANESGAAATEATATTSR